tara:strand:+ start:2048 stop:2494 length:447 start_codon:yes stop_codon:yes gene_type:complete
MKTVTDIPLYDVIQSIEEKHGSDVHMVIEALLPDGKTPEDYKSEAEVPVDELMWWCEFQDKVKVFDNIARVKDWFLNDVEFDAVLEAEAKEMGDLCWHYPNGDLVRNEEGEVIHTDEEFNAYMERHPEKFNSPQEECEDCTGWPEGVE